MSTRRYGVARLSLSFSSSDRRRSHRAQNRWRRRYSGLLLSTLVGWSAGWSSALPAYARPTDYLAQAAPPTPAAYTLGAGDLIHVDVFDAPEYTGEYQVLPDGSISLPMIGVVSVSGLTLAGAADVLSSQLSDILRRPITTVRLVSARPIAFAVAGEINRPGAYTIDTETVGGTPTVTSAIQLAGGITQKANIRSVQVMRVNPRTRQPQQTFVADLWQLVQQGDLQQDISLQDGDRIIIPEATRLGEVELTGLETANIYPEFITVNVVGEVSSPGSVTVPPNTPLNQAILAAGGFNNRARKKRVELVRLNANGSVTKREIEVDLTADAGASINPPLQPNDTVIVDRSTFTRVTDQVGQVVAPIGGIFSLFRIFGF